MQQKFAMIQKLLADRFQLSFHFDKRELPVYVISIAKGGPKLAPREADADEPGWFQWPDLYKAFQEQLGLKLESIKAPVDVMVIDHAERPSAN